jgi:hypothetical protein
MINNEEVLFVPNAIFGVIIICVICSLMLGINPLTSTVLILSICILVNTMSVKVRDIFTINNSEISWGTQRQISLNNSIQKLVSFFTRKPSVEKFRREAKINLLDKRTNITSIYLLNCLEKRQERQTFYQIIQVCTEEKTFTLPKLTIDEGSWLINELSSWLKLPIEVRSQTIKR